MHIYVKDCLERNVEPDPNNFTVWCNTKVKNNNYHLYYEIVFDILLGMKCFCSGIQWNNSLFTLAGRQKVTPLTFINNHLICRDLIINGRRVRIEAPEEITFISRIESYSRSGDPSNREGGDYVTENENRHLKSHLSPGVPSLKNWQEAARNHDILTKNREMLFKRLSITDLSSEDSSTFRFDNEILIVRLLIRQSTLLPSPWLEKDIMALDGTILHTDLVNFYFTAKGSCHSYSNYYSYWPTTRFCQWWRRKKFQ